MTPEEKFQQLSLNMPPAPKPIGIYKPLLIVGELVYVSGHGPMLDHGIFTEGKVGGDVDIEQAKEAARLTGMGILASLRANLGSLDRIERVVKVFGMVNAVPDFYRHPYVIDGCSELFVQIWGDDHGVGVRSAVGMGSLPDRISVEIETIFKLK